MKQKIIFFILAVILLACGNRDEIVETEENTIVTTGESTNEVTAANATECVFIPYPDLGSNGDTRFSEFWGTAYDANSILMGYALKKNEKVIDMEKLYDNKNFSFAIIQILSSGARTRVYSNSSDYLSQTSFSKEAIEKMLPPGKLSQPNRLFAEIIIDLKKNAYNWLVSSHTNNIIAESYLHPKFREMLYNSTMENLLNTYGQYVLTEYFTGWKMVLFYTALHNGNKSVEEKESDFFSFVNSTFNNETAKNKEGKTYNKQTIAYNNKYAGQISDVEISVRNIGGGGSFSDATGLKNLKNVVFSLNQWYNTLNDDNYKITEAREKGLKPISDFFLEENFKERAKKFVSGRASTKTLQSPSIHIINHKDNEGKNILSTYLLTRFGDYILLDTQKPASDEDNLNKMEILKERKKEFYGVEIINTTNTPVAESTFSLNGLDESKMKKYINQHNKITYLLYSDTGKKYAFSVYNDSIKDIYGIKKWIDKLPEINIRSYELYKYKIIAL